MYLKKRLFYLTIGDAVDSLWKYSRNKPKIPRLFQNTLVFPLKIKNEFSFFN